MSAKITSEALHVTNISGVKHQVLEAVGKETAGDVGLLFFQGTHLFFSNLRINMFAQTLQRCHDKEANCEDLDNNVQEKLCWPTVNYKYECI